MKSREARVVANESLVREVNERIEDVNRGFGSDEEMELLCECGEPGCLAPISLTRREYESLRATPTHFAILPGHEHPEIEQVVALYDHFAVVEKLPGGPAEDAIARDPRS